MRVNEGDKTIQKLLPYLPFEQEIEVALFLADFMGMENHRFVPEPMVFEVDHFR